MIGVFIVAEVRLYREGLALSLARRRSINVLGTAALDKDISKRLEDVEPDVVLFDVLRLRGHRNLKELVQGLSKYRLVALGVSDTDDEVIACAELGVSGLVSREASMAELVAALTSAMQGEMLCSPKAAAAMARRVASMSGDVTESSAFVAPLTNREMDIAGLVDRGLSNKEIARELGIEIATVKNHIHHIFEKLHVRRRSEAVAHLRDCGILPLAGVGSFFQIRSRA